MSCFITHYASPLGRLLLAADEKGLTGLWLSPLGPIVLSLAAPLNEQDGDETEFFQFSFGVPLN